MRGYVDEITPGWVTGWYDGPYPVSIFVNGKEIAQANVTGARPDAGDTARGFYRRITRFLIPGENVVVVKCNGDQLPNGEVVLHYDPGAVVNQHWSYELATGRDLVLRWIQSDQIVRHINKHVCGESIPGLSQGLYRWMKNEYKNLLPARDAVSVGCGTGTKEMDMLEAGLVEHFNLYDIAEGALEVGKEDAAKRGLSDRVTFYHGDGFAEAKGPYDLVLWNSALHHMPDAYAAVRWSRDVLRDGGMFVLDEFVGPSRMQYSQEILEINSKYRRELKTEYLANPFKPDEMVETEMVNIDVDELMLLDPSEAADSGNILPALAQVFPNATVKYTGGMVYHFGMCDVLHNFKDDPVEIARGLALDDQCRDRGVTQFAVAIAVK